MLMMWPAQLVVEAVGPVVALAYEEQAATVASVHLGSSSEAETFVWRASQLSPMTRGAVAMAAAVAQVVMVVRVDSERQPATSVPSKGFDLGAEAPEAEGDVVDTAPVPAVDPRWQFCASHRVSVPLRAQRLRLSDATASRWSIRRRPQRGACRQVSEARQVKVDVMTDAKGRRRMAHQGSFV